jgi:hypothetical protein
VIAAGLVVPWIGAAVFAPGFVRFLKLHPEIREPSVEQLSGEHPSMWLLPATMVFVRPILVLAGSAWLVWDRRDVGMIT